MLYNRGTRNLHIMIVNGLFTTASSIKEYLHSQSYCMSILPSDNELTECISISTSDSCASEIDDGWERAIMGNDSGIDGLTDVKYPENEFFGQFGMETLFAKSRLPTRTLLLPPSTKKCKLGGQWNNQKALALKKERLTTYSKLLSKIDD